MRSFWTLAALMAVSAPMATLSETCTNGLPGISSGDICCDEGCVKCGGAGCGRRGNGLTSSDCCVGKITNNGATCSESGEAPCIMDEDEPLSTCSNGIVGVQTSDACCNASCGTCGGRSCVLRGIGFGVECCVGVIMESGEMCSITGAAPCIVDETPPPTPSPVSEGACDTNPCLNGGSCSVDVGGGHTCTCVSGYGGMACQTDTSSLSKFYIELKFEGTWSSARKAIFQSAADRWAQVITHVPCGGNSLYPAGRLLITSTLDEIDGFGDFLRFAGPTAVWNSCKMLLFNFKTVSFLGFMEFDIADIGDLEDYGMLEDLVLHEMGHVIGFGTLWGPGFGGCSECQETGNPSWTCPAAIETYLDLGGSDADIMELDGTEGTRCYHLDEDIFFDELMTGFLDDKNAFSKMTASVLDDLNYIVHPSAVDPYILPSKRSNTLGDIAPPAMSIHDVNVETMIVVMDEDGNETNVPNVIMQF